MRTMNRYRPAIKKVVKFYGRKNVKMSITTFAQHPEIGCDHEVRDECVEYFATDDLTVLIKKK